MQRCGMDLLDGGYFVGGRGGESDKLKLVHRMLLVAKSVGDRWEMWGRWGGKVENTLWRLCFCIKIAIFAWQNMAGAPLGR